PVNRPAGYRPRAASSTAEQETFNLTVQGSIPWRPTPRRWRNGQRGSLLTRRLRVRVPGGARTYPGPHGGPGGILRLVRKAAPDRRALPARRMARGDPAVPLPPRTPLLRAEGLESQEHPRPLP